MTSFFKELQSSMSPLYPSKPKFTEKNIGDLSGKVYIVTGANTGIGKEVSRLLHARNARVFLGARSEQKTIEAIADIKKQNAQSSGSLEYLYLNLGDLTTIKTTVNEFLSKSDGLDVLFNNAGVAWPENGSKTTQGYELQMGTNCLGPHLFTKLLTHILQKTASKPSTPSTTVRVVWVSSSAMEGLSPKDGVPIDNITYRTPVSNSAAYGISKAGNYFCSTEFARRYGQSGIMSVALNPGNLNSDLWRSQGSFMSWFLKTFILYPVVYGAYTELYAALAEEVGSVNGGWIVPFTRFGKIYRKDLVLATKTREEGGSGVASDFWEWCEKETKEYA